jgi:hypothetical protein
LAAAGNTPFSQQNILVLKFIFTTLGDKWLRRIVSKHTAKQTFGDSGSKYKFLQQNKKTA